MLRGNFDVQFSFLRVVIHLHTGFQSTLGTTQQGAIGRKYLSTNKYLDCWMILQPVPYSPHYQHSVLVNELANLILRRIECRSLFVFLFKGLSPRQAVMSSSTRAWRSSFNRSLLTRDASACWAFFLASSSSKRGHSRTWIFRRASLRSHRSKYAFSSGVGLAGG